MQLLWNKQIPSSNPWEPEYEGVFCKIQNTVYFCFKDSSAVAVLAEDMTIPQQITPGSEGTIPLPGRWILMEALEPACLFLNEKLVLNLRDMTFLQPDPVRLGKYHEACRPEKFYVEAPFVHGEYCITHKGQWGYECTKNGNTIWEFQGKGYLYTDICRWSDRLFFGTAGRGGYFYILNAETGEVVSAVKTGGTASMIQIENECYILSNEKSAVLLCVDLRDGSILESVPLPGKANTYSRLREIDGKIHAVTFEYKRKEMQSALWSCLQI